jgi:glycoside/pentoside/hexuronide:cation symporter, GPH family
MSDSPNKLRPLMYGMAELGPASIDIFLKVYLLLYFNVVLGLSPSLTSLAIGLGVLWDALLDPWIGVYSDRYYKKNGHRKFLIYSAILISVALFLFLWRIPHMSQWPTFWCLFFVSSLLNSAISLFSVPHIAVANDLELDNEKRKVWIGWRLAFFNVGSFIGLVVPAYYLTRTLAVADPDTATPYKQATLVLAVIMLICSFCSITYVYAKSKFIRSEHEQAPQVKLSGLIKDLHFLRMMASYFVVNCGLGLNSALALYYYKNYLNFTEKQTQTILVGFLFVFTFSIPLWVYFTRFFDKRKLIVVGAFMMGLLTVGAFPHIQGIDFWIIFCLASVLGGVLVGVAVVLEIYLSDFLKEKEDETLQSVSGKYLGIWKMAAKVSRAVAIALAGPILENSNNSQVLANYFGWGVGLFFLLSALVMSIPINSLRTDRQQ